MSEVTYRNATVADVPAILALWREFWTEQPYEVNLEPKIRSEPDTVYIAEADGRIVGTIIGGFDGWWGWLYRIAVTEAFQGQGIATHLIEEMQRRLKAKGATGVGSIVSPVKRQDEPRPTEAGLHRPRPSNARPQAVDV